MDVFFCFFFLVVWQKLLSARALRVQEDAGETGPAHNKGRVAKTARKSRADASRGGRNRVPQGFHTSIGLRKYPKFNALIRSTTLQIIHIHIKMFNAN